MLEQEPPGRKSDEAQPDIGAVQALLQSLGTWGDASKLASERVCAVARTVVTSEKRTTPGCRRRRIVSYGRNDSGIM